MTLAQFPEIRRLTRTQKLKLAEELWLDAVDDSMPVQAKHRQLIETRWQDYRSGKMKRISLDELESRISLR